MLSKCGFVFVFFWSTALGLSPIVETPFGTVEGFEYESARVFLGIRFAEPPVGSRRFEKPGNVKKWTGVLRAKKFGPSCYSTIASGPWSDFEYSEDCLSLNIIAPKENKPEGYPVVFFVHGGGFEFDTATLLGYKKIENNFVSQGIVFVTFNYRLGPFGFLTTENDLLPGNLGLWDQSAALQFVHEVISSFGGNPSRITAMGESAGGISVSALTLCEHTRDFIQKAIQISGSSYMIPLAGQDKFGLQFLAEIGCLSEDSGELKKCLKAKTRQEIMETEAYLAPPLSSDKPIGGRYFPYIDRDFFRADLQTLAKASRPIPTMIGMNQVEAAVFVFSTENASYIEVPPSEYSSYSAEDLKKSLEKIASNISDLAPLLERFYLNQGSNISQDSVFFLTQLVNVASDIAFVLPSFQELLEKMRLNWPVHLFVEEFYNDCEQRRAMIRVPGSSHANELPFLFDNPPMFPTSDEESSEKFRRNMVEGFVSFVKSSDPMVDGIPWVKITKDDAFKYMALDAESGMKTGFFQRRIEFWLKTVAQKVDLNKLAFLLPQIRKGLL